MCREQILHLCRVAKKKLAMEFNMNIIFSDNSNNNADGSFKLHKYTEVCFFYLHYYEKLPLDHWYYNSRFSFVAVILHELILILSLPFFFRKILFSRQPI